MSARARIEGLRDLPLQVGEPYENLWAAVIRNAASDLVESANILAHAREYDPNGVWLERGNHLPTHAFLEMHLARLEDCAEFFAGGRGRSTPIACAAIGLDIDVLRSWFGAWARALELDLVVARARAACEAAKLSYQGSHVVRPRTIEKLAGIQASAPESACRCGAPRASTRRAHPAPAGG